MATNYPGSLDTSTEQPSPSASTEMDDAGFEHDVVHTNHSGAIIALETKLGSGDSNATSGAVLVGTGSGTSAWDTTPTFDGVSPTGAVVMWSGSSAPSGWLECDGSAVSRTTYSSLFAVIGTRYGVGDGSTTFNLPNPVDRVAMGIALATAPTTNTLAVSSNLTALSLSAQDTDHTHSGVTDQDGQHSHNVNSGGGHTHNVNSGGSHSHTANSAGNHNHTTSNTGNHNHNLSNNTVGHSHSYTKPNSGSTGNANPGTQSANHKHNVSNTGAHSHNISNTGAHTHSTTTHNGHTHTTATGGAHTHTTDTELNHTHAFATGNQSSGHSHTLSSSSITSTVNVEPFGFIIKT